MAKRANKNFPSLGERYLVKMSNNVFERYVSQDIRPSKRKKVCWDVSSYESQAPVLLFDCHGQGGNQAWRRVLFSVPSKLILNILSYKYYRYDKKRKWLIHGGNPRCLDCNLETKELFVTKCDKSSKTQRWKIEKINEKQLANWDDPTKNLF